MGEDDRDRFEGMMSGAFSQLENNIGPEMQQTLLEHNRIQNDLAPKIHAQHVKTSDAQIEAYEAEAAKSLALGAFYVALALLMIMVGVAVLTVAFKW